MTCGPRIDAWSHAGPRDYEGSTPNDFGLDGGKTGYALRANPSFDPLKAPALAAGPISKLVQLPPEPWPGCLLARQAQNSLALIC